MSKATAEAGPADGGFGFGFGTAASVSVTVPLYVISVKGAAGFGDGQTAKDVARRVITAAGFEDVRADQRVAGGMAVAFTARYVSLPSPACR